MAGPALAQAPAPSVTLQVQQQPLPVVLQELERQTHYSFVYSNLQLSEHFITRLQLRDVPLEQALPQLLAPLGLGYRILGQQIILTQVAPTPGRPRTLEGQVLDAQTGAGLPGASVWVRATQRGTATTAEGTFRLPLTSADSVVVVSSLGYAPQEARLTPDNTLKISLQPDTRLLSEVVVTGLGLTQERRALGYAVQTLPGSELVVARELNFINSVSGRVAGMQVSRSGTGPTGSTNVILRGYTSLTRDSRPLVVVDGVPIDNRSLLQPSRFGGFDSGDGLATINPEDIESVSVLKGGNAAALYGNRASNGALIITTKRGGQGPGLTVSSTTSFDRVQLLTDYQNEYGQGQQGHFLADSTGRILLTAEGYPQVQMAGATVGSWGPRMEGQLVKHWNNVVKPFSPQPDNPQAFFQTGFTTANSAALRMGTGGRALRVAFTDMRNRSTYPNNLFVRDFLTVRGATQLTARLMTEVKAAYVYTNGFNRPTQAAHPDNVMTQFAVMPRNVDLADLQLYRNPANLQPIIWNQNPLFSAPNNSRQNPYWSAQLNTNGMVQHRLNGSARVRYTFTDKLWLQVRAGTDRYTTNLDYRYASYTSWNTTAQPDRGGLGTTTIVTREDNLDFILNGQQPIGSTWQLTGQLFGNLLQQRNETNGITGKGFVKPNVFKLSNLAAASRVYGFSRTEVQSLYGRAQLEYRNTVFLELTGRNDWDSTLPAGNWSYFYPSASGAIIYTDLLGWQSDWLRQGKLRASWAQVGKGANPYELTTKFDINTSGMTEAPGVGSSHLEQPFASLQDQIAPPRLKPQITNTAEIGSELIFGHNRAILDVTVYRTNTFNQVTAIPVAPTSGFRAQLVNAGNIRNQGVELTLSATPIPSTRKFSWTTALNWASNRSLVLRLGPTDETYLLGTESNSVAVVARVGHPFGDLYGTRLRRTPDGRLLVDTDGLPLKPLATLERLGNFQPRWFGGMSQEVRFRQLQLRVLVDARWGGQIYSASQQQASAFGNARATLAGRADWYASEEARKAAGVSSENWLPTGGLLVEGAVQNPDGSYSPSRRYVNPQSYWARLATISEPFVYDASFVKLRELTLTYQLPDAWVAKVGHLRSASLAFTARNLAFLYRATQGFDPESAYNLSLAQGLESGAYPNSRSLGYHLTLDF
ncbi:SusC/RagA family TonB-linked outer membrane protein [Hymenobacter sp. 102]|uniref:SusC/RagA family TonB-linked outer membrane protein n=1 Tax=Hymenobacter sp. 102 TaxID=3403152 RepID=UPI003CED81AC